MAGVRSSKTVGSTKYDFTTLSGLVIRQTGGGKTIDFVYDENNQPLAMKYNNTLYYYVLNAQGDVVRIVNSSRSVVASYTYDPWGKIISSSGTLADINPLRYRGYYYDSETGFYYLQSRYYDPEIGRFINADSYASTDATGLLSTNMFAYCENDPVNNYDDSGRFCAPAALVNGILSAGLAVAGACVDSLQSGEAINGKALVSDTIVAFASGFVKGGFGTGIVSNLVDIANIVYAFGSTASRGGTLEDSVLSAASAYFGSKIGNSIDKHFGKTTTDMIANSIAGATIQGELQGIIDVGQAVINQTKKHSTTKKKTTKKNNKTRLVKSNTKQIHVHAFGAW